MNKTTYICQLPLSIQQAIKEDLLSLDLSSEDIQNALDGRLCDLEDTININQYLI